MLCTRLMLAWMALAVSGISANAAVPPGFVEEVVVTGLTGPVGVAFGPNCGVCEADLDADCTVGAADLLILLGHWR